MSSKLDEALQITLQCDKILKELHLLSSLSQTCTSTLTAVRALVPLSLRLCGSDGSQLAALPEAHIFTGATCLCYTTHATSGALAAAEGQALADAVQHVAQHCPQLQEVHLDTSSIKGTRLESWVLEQLAPLSACSRLTAASLAVPVASAAWVSDSRYLPHLPQQEVAAQGAASEVVGSPPDAAAVCPYGPPPPSTPSLSTPTAAAADGADSTTAVAVAAHTIADGQPKHRSPLRSLAALPHLQDVTLKVDPRVDLTPLVILPRLRRLQLTGVSSATQLFVLSRLCGLQELVLVGVQSLECLPAAPAGCSQGQQQAWPQEEEEEEQQQLVLPSTLTRLELRRAQEVARWLPHLAHCSRLQHLVLEVDHAHRHRCYAPGDFLGVSIVPKLPRLEHLQLDVHCGTSHR